jgi:hypothetical protein
MSFPADGGDSAMNPLSPSAAALTESGFTGSECSTPTSDSNMVANLSSVSIGEFASKAQVGEDMRRGLTTSSLAYCPSLTRVMGRSTELFQTLSVCLLSCDCMRSCITEPPCCALVLTTASHDLLEGQL